MRRINHIIILSLSLLLLSSCDNIRMDGFPLFGTFDEEQEKDNYLEISGRVFQLLHQDPAQARKIARHMLDSINGSHQKLEIELLKHIGSSHSIEGIFSEALQYYSTAIKKAEAIDSYEQIADINNNIAVVNRNMGNYKNAFIHFTNAISFYEQTGDITGKANALNNKGLMYIDLDNYELARGYLEEALEDLKITYDTIGIAVVKNNLSLIYIRDEDFETAFEYLDHSLELARTTKNQYLMTISLQVKGNIYTARNEIDKAIEAYKKSLSIAKEVNQPYQANQSLLNIALAHFSAGDTDKALATALEVMEAAKDLNNIILINTAHHGLYSIYKAIGQYEKSLNHYIQYNKTKENLLNQTIIHQIYDYEIANLNQLNQLKQLEIESKELSISKKNNLLIFTIVAFLLTMAVLYFFYQNNRNRQKMKLQQTIAYLTEKKAHAAVEAEIQERKRIGQELHDCLGQMLSVTGLHISILQQKKNISEQRREALLCAAMRSVDEAFTEVRNISHNLAPSLLSERGLEGALKQLSDQINQSNRLHMTFETFGLNGNISSLVENTLFRAIQEVLNNTIKHSGARTLSIQLTQGATDISLMAEDDGKGFDLQAVKNKKGSGLHHMKSRVENLNGSLHIDSAPERGTIVSIVVPIKTADNEI